MSVAVHPDPAALKALQEELYRERVLRARSMTEEERFSDGFELTNAVFERMLGGAMWQKGLTDRDEGWKLVRRQLDRLARVHDAGRFTATPPSQS